MRALVVDEKQHRVVNFMITNRAGLSALTAAAGLRSPTQFTRDHAVWRGEGGAPKSGTEVFPYPPV